MFSSCVQSTDCWVGFESSMGQLAGRRRQLPCTLKAWDCDFKVLHLMFPASPWRQTLQSKTLKDIYTYIYICIYLSIYLLTIFVCKAMGRKRAILLQGCLCLQFDFALHFFSFGDPVNLSHVMSRLLDCGFWM